MPINLSAERAEAALKIGNFAWPPACTVAACLRSVLLIFKSAKERGTARRVAWLNEEMEVVHVGGAG